MFWGLFGKKKEVQPPEPTPFQKYQAQNTALLQQTADLTQQLLDMAKEAAQQPMNPGEVNDALIRQLQFTMACLQRQMEFIQSHAQMVDTYLASLDTRIAVLDDRCDRYFRSHNVPGRCP